MARTSLSKGPAYVPLEVSTHGFDDDLDEESAAYRHRPFSQRMARRRPVPRNTSRLVGGVAVLCILGALALWAWASVLLLLKLNTLRQPHEGLVQDVVEGPQNVEGPLNAPAVEPAAAPLALPAP
ncbi:unnamed protein product [Effrenium voratum]|uniref:Uncharacterized protein n=1 Tax=Effrenium voratum TaxID=2562239 RepID=A0AA36IN78_9DINO|nr:unnamed protein product [Effrenium voratum]